MFNKSLFYKGNKDNILILVEELTVIVNILYKSNNLKDLARIISNICLVKEPKVRNAHP